MDDDLKALLDSMDDDDEEEDDLLGAFVDPTGGAGGDDLTLPDWMAAGLAEQQAPPSSPATAPGHLTGEGGDPDWLTAAMTPSAETLPDTPSVSEPFPELESEPSTPTEAGGRPEWLSELDPGLGPLPEDDLAAEPAPKSRRRRAAASSKPGVLTPQQRMLLSIFLFLDIAVLGCFLLLAIGAISF
jgi:hypothetical protein